MFGWSWFNTVGLLKQYKQIGSITGELTVPNAPPLAVLGRVGQFTKKNLFDHQYVHAVQWKTFSFYLNWELTAAVCFKMLIMWNIIEEQLKAELRFTEAKGLTFCFISSKHWHFLWVFYRKEVSETLPVLTLKFRIWNKTLEQSSQTDVRSVGPHLDPVTPQKRWAHFALLYLTSSWLRRFTSIAFCWSLGGKQATPDLSPLTDGVLIKPRPPTWALAGGKRNWPGIAV